MNTSIIPEYGWSSSAPENVHSYLLSALVKALEHARSTKLVGRKLRVFDAGCGNGYVAGQLIKSGFDVSGCDASQKGIEEARKSNPTGNFEVSSVYDDLLSKFGGNWDVVISSEVVEHLYDPRCFVRQVNKLLVPGGTLIITTPYHGYFKNLVLALSGKMDKHFTALWDGGHIKFWSFSTLSRLLDEQGFSGFKFYGAGRVPFLWKSMVISARNGT